MIEQQYYTRERRGIFRSAEGYDSIAKSEGLSDSFIKKYLHPFCFYNPPRSLESSEKADVSEYPQALICYFPEGGELVLGNSTYVGVDFTGLRNTFFTHNFIIPANEKKEYIENFQRCIFAKGFASSYDIEKGKLIDKIRELQYDSEQDRLASREILTDKLGITEEVYKKLLYAAFMSTSDKKKIYVAFDADSRDISKYAKILLKYIFAGLPYELRNNMGFLTYSREPEGRKYINITFVEAGSIRSGDSRTERDYIFDFSQRRILNADVNTDRHPYLDFAWRRIMEGNMPDGFFRFCEKMLGDVEKPRKLAIESYDQLSLLYKVKSDCSIYKKDREEIFKIIYGYLDERNIENKNELKDMLISLFNIDKNDMIDKSYIPSHGSIKYYIKYYEMGINEAKIPFLVLLAIKNGKSGGSCDYAFEALEIASKNGSLFEELIHMGFEYKFEAILEEYLVHKLKSARGLRELLKEIGFWGAASLEVLSWTPFKAETLNRIREVLNESGDKLAAVKEMREFFQSFNKLEAAGHEAAYFDYSRYIMEQVDRIVYNSIDIEKLRKEDIAKLKYIKLESTEEKSSVLQDIQHLLLNADNSKLEHIKEKICDRKSIGYSSEIKSLIKRLFINDINRENYNKIILAFISGGIRREIEYDYKALLKYIYEYSSKTGVYDFILWSFENGTFKNSGNCMEYNRAIKNHLLNNDRQALKNKEIKMKLYNNADPVLKSILDETQYELYNPLQKFIRINSKPIKFVVSGAFILLLLTWGAFNLLKIPGEKPPVSREEDKAALQRVEEAIKLDMDKLLEGRYSYRLMISTESLNKDKASVRIEVEDRSSSKDDGFRYSFRRNVYLDEDTLIKVSIFLNKNKALDTTENQQELESLFEGVEKIVLEKCSIIEKSQ